MSVEERHFDDAIVSKVSNEEMAGGKTGMMTAAVGLSALMTIAGCSAANENTCEETTALKAKIERLESERDPNASFERAMEVDQSGVYSYGTVGAKWLRSGEFNRFKVQDNFSGEVHHHFIFWPPIFRKEELQFIGKDGIENKLEVIPFGQHFAVVYRSKLEDKPKEIFAIDANGERFVVGFERTRD